MSINASDFYPFAHSVKDRRVLLHRPARPGRGVLPLWRVCRRFPRLPFTLLVGVAALLFAGLDGAPHLSSRRPSAAETIHRPPAGGFGLPR